MAGWRLLLLAGERWKPAFEGGEGRGGGAVEALGVGKRLAHADGLELDAFEAAVKGVEALVHALVGAIETAGHFFAEIGEVDGDGFDGAFEAGGDFLT
jgi:hypothetical protein